MFSHKSFSDKSFSPTSFRFDLEPTPLPPVAGVDRLSVSGSGKSSKATRTRRLPDWLDNQGKLAKLHQDDQVVTELLVSLVTKGFFHDCQELRTKL